MPKKRPDKIPEDNPLCYVTKSGHKLTPKETRFCFAYIENMGNGVKAAYTAKYSGSYGTMRRTASDNLAKPHILECIRELYDKTGLNHEIVDTELAFVVKQHGNINAKIKGIHEYNQIHGRHAPEMVVPLSYEQFIRRKRAQSTGSNLGSNNG